MVSILCYRLCVGRWGIAVGCMTSGMIRAEHPSGNNIKEIEVRRWPITSTAKSSTFYIMIHHRYYNQESIVFFSPSHMFISLLLPKSLLTIDVFDILAEVILLPQCKQATLRRILAWTRRWTSSSLVYHPNQIAALLALASNCRRGDWAYLISSLWESKRTCHTQMILTLFSPFLHPLLSNL